MALAETTKRANCSLKFFRTLKTVLIGSLVVFLLNPCAAKANIGPKKDITITAPKIKLSLDLEHRASITSLVVNGQSVIDTANGVYSFLKVDGITYSSLHLKASPNVGRSKNVIRISGINYGDKNLTISENWTFTTTPQGVKWYIERKLSKAVKVEEAGLPQFNFRNIKTWEGAYQGYGGLAWFYLFNEKLCTYGVHTRSSDFWNSKTNNGLDISVDAKGQNVAMKYCRAADDALEYGVTVSPKEMQYKLDSGTNRRRFLRKRTDVWAPFLLAAGTTSETITFTGYNFDTKYNRGKLAGVNGKQVGAVLNTIAHIGVIDSLHFGGNSWATPYGPICLHEQYIAQMGLGINDQRYLSGYQSCLDFYRDHAIKPDGRVYPRWAYTNEDAMRGVYNSYGFYEAQWGYLLDSNPDYVSNVADLYDMTGDTKWVKTHQLACEKALGWLLKRDSNHNGLVEMLNNNQSERKSSDWIDIIWASYENAFVNAKLYHALTKWAVIEQQLGNKSKSAYYSNFAQKLKTSFNKPTTEGGFWDEENKCYIHWRDKDNTIHGRNIVTPVNFMAITYGICDNAERQKTILDKIEAQMEQEKLFFWPLCMTTYAKGEGNDWQFPFPAYENGDLFLSWGSIGVAAYAGYKPSLALKYVKNVLEQYSKDGLAYQRYGRVKQDGLGDDILSGNSLTIVGLYQAIYGINPLYNRFYLDPHITPELAGTELNYNFRHQRLKIKLDMDKYSVSNKMFTVVSNQHFGFNAYDNSLSYFNGDDASASLQLTAAMPLTINIKNWDKNKIEWEQHTGKTAAGPIVYHLKQLKPNTYYAILVNGRSVGKMKADGAGDVLFNRIHSAVDEKINIDRI
jgi:hypothetical protein